MHLCMQACVHVYMYVRSHMYVLGMYWIYVCVYVCTYVHMYVLCMQWTYVCIYVCMYVCN